MTSKEEGWLQLVDNGVSTPAPDKCNPSILGKAGTGAVLSLDAIGLQDTFLTSNTGNSYFQFQMTKHTQFTKFSASIQLNNDGSTNWPFNQKIPFNLRPKEMGDILNNMYLKCTLPSLTTLYPGTNYQYCNDVGWAILNQIQFNMDDVILEIIKCDWNIVYSDLYYTKEEKDALLKMVNVDPYEGGNLYIPLNFFFSRTHSTSFTGNPLIKETTFKPGFLTCAAHKHRNMTITVTFNPVSFFTSAPAVSFPNMYLVTEEVVLGDSERQYIQNNTQQNMVSFARNDAVSPITGTPFRANLTPNIPVKTLHWFARNTAYEDTGNSYYFNNRFNFTNSLYILPFSNTNTLQQQESNNPILCQSIIYLNGVQLLGVSKSTTDRSQRDGSYYYKFSQPANHSLSAPSHNIYTFSFCIYPKDPQPSGSLDFSQMDSTITFLSGSLYYLAPASTQWNLYIYYTCYNQVTYSNGLVSLNFGW
jgi:hypothetical protein